MYLIGEKFIDEKWQMNIRIFTVSSYNLLI